MKSIKRSLIKSSLLLNKTTYTDKQSPIIRIGNNFYIFRILYILSRGNLNNCSKDNKATFYLKTKMSIKKNMNYTKPSEKDVIVESYKSLIVFIANFCQIKDMNNYKIVIFNTFLQTIDGNDQLMNYKDKIIYAKIKENKIENLKKVDFEENTNYYKIIKKLNNKRLSPINNKDDKGNTIKSNKTLFALVKNSFRDMKPKGHFNVNQSIINQSLKKDTNKNSTLSIDLNTNNNKLTTKILFEKKLNKVCLKFNHNSFELGKEDNDISFNSNRVTKDNFYNIDDKSNFINKLKNIHIKNSLTKTKFYISSSESELFKYKNKRIKNKATGIDRMINSFNNSKNKGVQAVEAEKSFNTKKNYIYNNFFNNIIKKHNYSALLKRKQSNSMHNTNNMNNDSISNINEIKIFNKTNSLFNKKLFIKNSRQFSKLKTIFRYLKYPKLKGEQSFENYENKETNTLSFIKLKEIYDQCLSEINIIFNNINEYFPDITYLIQQNDIFFMNRYKNIDISNCLKQFLLYSFLENCIDEQEDISINFLIFLIDREQTEEYYYNSEKLLISFYQKISKTKENQNFDLIEYIQSKKKLKNFQISKKFFFVFILCTNFFDKLQRDIGKRMLMSLDIDNFVNFKTFANYYLYFKDNKSLNIENKLNFITKYLYIVDSGCNEEKDPDVINKFKNDICYAFKIDERTRSFLLGNIQVENLSYILKKRINDVFNNMINYFRTNIFKTIPITNFD